MKSIWTDIKHVDTHFTSDPQEFGPANMETVLTLNIHFLEGATDEQKRAAAKFAINRYFKNAPANRYK